MSPIILFALILIVSFVVVLFFLRPTKEQTAIQRQLEVIETDRSSVADVPSILKEEKLSSIPVLDELLKQLPGSWKLLRLIHQAGSKWQVSNVILFSLLGTLATWWIASFWIPNLALSALIGIAVGLSPYGYLYFMQQKRFKDCDLLLPEAADLMARALRAGHAMGSVLEMVGREIRDPLGSEMFQVYEEQSLGLPLRDAILRLVDRLPSDDMRFLTTAILLQKETGGNLAQILDKAATVMRERVRLRGQVKIYTAQGRVTGWIICAIPFLLAGLISLTNHDYEKLLFTDPIGVDLVYVGLVMMVIGALIIRKIINIKI